MRGLSSVSPSITCNWHNTWLFVMFGVFKCSDWIILLSKKCRFVFNCGRELRTEQPEQPQPEHWPVDLCLLPKACGINACCQSIRHRKQCTCPQDYVGSPSVECIPDKNECLGRPCGAHAICQVWWQKVINDYYFHISLFRILSEDTTANARLAALGNHSLVASVMGPLKKERLIFRHTSVSSTYPVKL